MTVTQWSHDQSHGSHTIGNNNHMTVTGDWRPGNEGPGNKASVLTQSGNEGIT